ncbi:YeeE/YedE family protein [Aliifodinibius sp. S!AR15-10]|uniref:YeeE/YedE family protein n=1 Tax=Aliifodinibius sp. S!AR15-10 TaxID=2950437 RepID=UPI002857BA92|nr:YeeE/YedE thiosulfate transporter family protein [Aliifodinibius sp. S!AR15-10]MDR8391674.1 YeeE/YedE family protein [Aliifodinibius sp. S!AR15-10]
MITELLTEPWPWYIAGPLIGLMLPLLLYIGNRSFGVSSSFRHVCSATLPSKIEYFNYNWRASSWNLWLVAGMIIGGFLGGFVFDNPEPIQLATETRQDLAALGISDFDGMIPNDLFNLTNLLSVKGLIVMILGGFLVGFGARYAGGCTSGHAITGMATFQKASLISTVGFFIGGLIVTYLLLPFILSL